MLSLRIGGICQNLASHWPFKVAGVCPASGGGVQGGLKDGEGLFMRTSATCFTRLLPYFLYCPREEGPPLYILIMLGIALENSLSLCLSLSVSLLLCLSLSLSVYTPVSPSSSVCLCLSLSPFDAVSLSAPISLPPSRSRSLSPSHSLSLALSLLPFSSHPSGMQRENWQPLGI